MKINKCVLQCFYLIKPESFNFLGNNNVAEYKILLFFFYDFFSNQREG